MASDTKIATEIDPSNRSVAELARVYATCPHCGAELVGIEKRQPGRLAAVELKYACGGQRAFFVDCEEQPIPWATCSKAPGETARRAATRAYVEAVAATAEKQPCPDEEMKREMISSVRSKRRWYSSS